MLELQTYNQELLNTKDQIKVDILKDSMEYLERFDLNHDMLLDAVSIIHRYLQISKRIPHNIFKYVIAAYYIIERHPVAFPVHQPKKEFCDKVGMKPSSLEYTVEKICNKLGFIRILDDMNFPYYLDPQMDLGYNLTKTIAKEKAEKVMMNFLLYHQPINSQILTEELTTQVIFEMNIFPEELLRQIYDLIYEIVEDNLSSYHEYADLQQQYFI